MSQKSFDGQEEHYEGIHDRFLRDPVYRDSQLKIGWTELKCIDMDKLAQEDHSYRLSQRYQKTLVSHIKEIGQECTDATSTRLPSGSHNHEPSPPRIRRSVPNLFLFNNIKDGTLLPQAIPGGTGTRPKAGGAHEFNSFFICCSSFRLPLIAICCNRRGVWTVHLIRHFFSCSEHALIVAHHTAWLKNVLVCVMSSAQSPMWATWLFVLSLFLTLFLSVCFSYLLLLLPEPWAVPLPPCGRHRGNIPLALRELRSLAPWPKMPLSQVMSPNSLTTSTTQRLLQWSSRGNSATRCPRTCLTRNSTTRPWAERSLHHCSFRSEKNQRTEDKLITFLKKVCCQLSPCLSVMQERGDPCMNLVR